MSLFKRAIRSTKKLKAAITGPSGSGKTFSSLLIASKLGNKIALIDTENQSASLYANKINFDTAQMNPPYSVAKYVSAIEEAVKNNYDVLIIDSLSHAWMGEGGILNKKEMLDSRGGNSFANWAKVNPELTLLVSTIIHAPIHIITTMRSKTEHVMDKDEKGKTTIQKVGMAPQMRDGIEYEFDIVFDLSFNHTFASSKDRLGLYADGTPRLITEKTGEEILSSLMINSNEEVTQK